jgi:hypothetical protein
MFFMQMYGIIISEHKQKEYNNIITNKNSNTDIFIPCMAR